MNGDPSQPENSGGEKGRDPSVSRRTLLKTGGAIAAGTGLAGLASEGSASAAPLPLPFASKGGGTLNIKFSGDLPTVQSHIQKANTAKQYDTSAVISGVLEGLVAEAGGLAAVQKSDFSLIFTLDFSLFSSF